ncbi:putative esterase [Talaromyces proteolyticus]|uniref:Esterase n=1 Tax=Talaromyces proteolyticus TaxID=1131652 RepID=A0AAD4KZK0_9EURO|nr:putative esterase [Talaromyces proteolyticus]KAH8704793.1 putative esterase [Talaromyces proteolyticus]
MFQPGETQVGNRVLHDLKPLFNVPPLHNSIPPQLAHRFDPVFVDYYNKYNAGRLYFDDVPIHEYRQNPLKYTIAYGRAQGPDIYRITEQKCPVKGGEITVRIFEPAPIFENGNDRKPMKRAAYINFHGGCWLLGGLASDHDFCKFLVDQLSGHMVVFDVDYRLAPEYPFPIPIEDSWAAFCWVRIEKPHFPPKRVRTQKIEEFNIDPDRFVVGGVSAGGHLASVVSHMCRDAAIPLQLQVLCVPICDLHNTFTEDGEFDRENCPYASYKEMEFSAGMTAARMSYCHKYFLGQHRPSLSDEAWKASPILAPNFRDLAAALIFTAEMDPLRDEGEAYAAKMRAAGSEVELVRMTAAPHSFAMLDGILESGKMYNRKVVQTLREKLSQ